MRGNETKILEVNEPCLSVVQSPDPEDRELMWTLVQNH